VKYLQKILKKQNVYNGNIDSWFGPRTRTAVKKFQKKYKKKYKLKETGKVDKKTFNALKKV
jgi:peptidoglycan hydrolase-like protein with peptidoglycan-binding domain